MSEGATSMATRAVFHSTWPGRIWNFFRCFMSVPFYFWAKCPRCGRWFGGHESGGSNGCRTTCWRCHGSIGWYTVGPGGAMRSRYYDGAKWAGDEVVGPAYFELNDSETKGAHRCPAP